MAARECANTHIAASTATVRAATIPQGLLLAPVPSLADFAFARHQDAEIRSAAGAGTPEYTAPEVGRGCVG